MKAFSVNIQVEVLFHDQMVVLLFDQNLFMRRMKRQRKTHALQRLGRSAAAERDTTDEGQFRNGPLTDDAGPNVGAMIAGEIAQQLNSVQQWHRAERLQVKPIGQIYAFQECIDGNPAPAYPVESYSEKVKQMAKSVNADRHCTDHRCP
ncbi:hypothetical protein AVO45_18720 [Ruegeria marisrubri]|uniref:Uncharacterized protein n=1 Tax=Ruegeria marisrubri TaxID=1685379 RepID=A0A0X3U4F7_9RHOB|nr:hypothetical protein AVO45_18720 [Ruegeria marisrubri]